MSCMKALVYCMLVAAISGALFVADGKAEDSLVVQSMAELSTPPADTVDAERVRIWLPLERSGRCRVKINILDSLNRSVRLLLDRVLSGGYYNFYWNKKDNYGQFVRPGHYKYKVDDCGDRSFGDLEVLIHPWELASRVIRSDSVLDKVWLTLEADSGLVSITILNRRDRFIVQPMVDSLMAPGRHELQWIPTKSGYTGVYLMQVNVGGYTHPSVEIRAAKNPPE